MEQLGEIWNVVVVGLLRGGLYAQMAIGLSLMLGVMSIISMVNGELYMIGAYIAYFAFAILGLNPILAIILAAAGAFIYRRLDRAGAFHNHAQAGRGRLVFEHFSTYGGSIISP